LLFTILCGSLESYHCDTVTMMMMMIMMMIPSKDASARLESVQRSAGGVVVQTAASNRLSLLDVRSHLTSHRCSLRWPKHCLQYLIVNQSFYSFSKV